MNCVRVRNLKEQGAIPRQSEARRAADVVRKDDMLHAYLIDVFTVYSMNFVLRIAVSTYSTVLQLRHTVLCGFSSTLPTVTLLRDVHVDSG